MAGYNGFSMSNNAVDAYTNGERPLSKWSKSDLLEEYDNVCDESDLKKYDLSKLRLDVLKRELLVYSSWHHTSSRFNNTDFYKIDVEACERLNNDKVKELEKERMIKEESKETIEKWEVKYLTWSGSRKHPKAIEHIEVVEYNTSKRYVNTKNGKKMITANGFKFIKKVED